jgi:hypothetical protein
MVPAACVPCRLAGLVLEVHMDLEVLACNHAIRDRLFRGANIWDSSSYGRSSCTCEVAGVLA